MERIARAATSGYEPQHTARVLVEEVRAALDCDQVLMLTPTVRSDGVCVQAVAPPDGGVPAGEAWSLGERTHRLFQRAFSHTDCIFEPHYKLADNLRAAGFESWVGVPLRAAPAGPVLGLLTIAARKADQHLRWAGHLHQVASAAREALAATAATASTWGQRAYESSHALGNLAFGLSHALGNIFGAILGNLHFLADEDNHDRRRELLQRIELSTWAGVEMMSALRGFLQPPATGLQQVDLSALALDVVGLVTRMCGLPAGAINTDLQDGCRLWGYPARLRECLVNVLFNALWAGGTVSVHTSVQADQTCSVSVRDTGCGMDEEVRRRATEPFFTTRPGRLGLGLSVARGIAVAHGGRLTLHSRPGRGTTVAIVVPTTRPGAAAMTDQVIAEALRHAQRQ